MLAFYILGKEVFSPFPVFERRIHHWIDACYTRQVMLQHSLYLHIPFCRHRCGYCDFNTYAGQEDLIPRYARALEQEMDWLQQGAKEAIPLGTVFFGGGTPSLLPLVELERVLGTIQTRFKPVAGLETTLEANPGTLSLAYLRGLRSLGVNRISLGVQSANPFELHFLERQHSFSDVIEAVKMARQAGLDNLNLDLIFGLPEQELSSWKHTLELTLGLQPEHLSLYALTLEHGTPLGHWARRGLVSTPDPDLAAEMYEWASERLEAAGFEQYEISNWARRDAQGNLLACQHNLQYWRNLPYIGLGAGAHGYLAGARTANVLSPAAYIARCQDGPGRAFPATPATQSVTPVNRSDEIGETMMMGLRLTQEGVASQSFQERFGTSLEAEFRPQIERFLRLGLLEWGGEKKERLRLSDRGRLLGNQVFMEFL